MLPLSAEGEQNLSKTSQGCRLICRLIRSLALNKLDSLEIQRLRFCLNKP